MIYSEATGKYFLCLSFIFAVGSYCWATQVWTTLTCVCGNSERRTICCPIESMVHLLLAGRNRPFDLRCLMNFSPISCKPTHPEMTGNFKHRCRKSCQFQQAKVMCLHLLPSRGVFQRVGQTSLGKPFEDYLRLILVLNTLLSPQRILQRKWFPAAFAENDTQSVLRAVREITGSC